MSIVARDIFAERIEQYVEQNPDASAPVVAGRFLLEPTDDQLTFIESMLSTDPDAGVDEDEAPQRPDETGGAGGVA